jgi:hypothetical protein
MLCSGSSGRRARGDLAERLAAPGPHPLPGDREAGRLHRGQAAQRPRGPQAVGGQADERPDGAGRIRVGLVDGHLRADPAQRHRARRPGDPAAHHRNPHDVPLCSFSESQFH